MGGLFGDKDQLDPVQDPLEEINNWDFIASAQLFSEFGCEFKIPGTKDQSPLVRAELIQPPIQLSGDFSHHEKNLINDQVLSQINKFAALKKWRLLK